MNVKFVREALTGSSEPVPVTSLSEVMRKSTESFVAAQKALAGLATKSRENRTEPHLVEVASD